MALSGAETGKRNPQYASRFIDTLGTGLGSINMVVDGSLAGGGPIEFFVTCPAGKKLELSMMSIFIEDSAMTADAYGGIANGLTNGITGFVDKVGVGRIPLFEQLPVRTNGDWAAYCTYQLSAYGSGNENLRFTYDFQAEGPGMILYPGDSGGLIIADDMDGLNKQVCRFGMTSYDYHETVI